MALLLCPPDTLLLLQLHFPSAAVGVSGAGDLPDDFEPYMMVFEAPGLPEGRVKVSLNSLLDGSFDVGGVLHRSVTDLYEASLVYTSSLA